MAKLRGAPYGRGGQSRSGLARSPTGSRPSFLTRIVSADRRALLLGTALASSLMALPMLTSAPAAAQVMCPQGNGPTPIMIINPGMAIVCVNNEARTNNAGDAIRLETNGAGQYITLDNSGNLTAINNAGDGYGIRARTGDPDSRISITNSGDIVVNTSEDGIGIRATSYDPNSPIIINNSGDMIISAGEDSIGIRASSYGANNPITIYNSGDFTVSAGEDGFGIRASAYAANNPRTINNSGDFTVNAGEDGFGILVASRGANTINNSGNFTVNAGEDGFGISAFSSDPNSPISIANSGDIAVNAEMSGSGILSRTVGADSDVSITNSGDISVSAGVNGYGIYGRTLTAGSVSITNSGDIAVSAGAYGVGVRAFSVGANSPIMIVNSGDVFGSYTGIGSRSILTSTTINNLAGGSISAGSGLAIDVDDAAGQIFNAGLITGFIDLTDNADLFVNQSGGVFQAQGTSLFGMGNDLFINEISGVVDTANNPLADEMVSFQGLETFQNFGTISLQDGAPGDLFTIANTPGGTDLNYIAGSFLAVDAFLGGPGSRSDIFRIDGNVAGVTHVVVNNTNPLPGTFNPQGITVAQVRGNVANNGFVLANGPIDTGFFNFDLFTENDGTFTNFELRSFPGAGAQLLPQLVTAAQDIWHQTSDTWFDRSADLRTQLWRNGGSVAGMPGVMSLGGGSVKDGVVAEQGGLSPAVWARVSHGELEQDGSAQTNAFGRSFSFNLDRELYIIDVQSGVDFALQGVMNPSDVLLLSVFGGGVSANLQYDQLDRRRFDYDGGQVGVAATYLSGGLFVDALFNAQFLELDPNALGFAESLDSNAYGFRIDSGYRFGMGSGGLFLEPLLTLAYVNSDLDGFSFAGNTVSFQDEDSLRGRVGLRAGTSLFIENVRFEPFVIASYWGELSDDDNRATLVSSGTRFGFRDAREDSWGEVSLGTNTFLAGNNALSAFSKIDIIFGDDTEGYIAQSGFRVQW